MSVESATGPNPELAASRALQVAESNKGGNDHQSRLLPAAGEVPRTSAKSRATCCSWPCSSGTNRSSSRLSSHQSLLSHGGDVWIRCGCARERNFGPEVALGGNSARCNSPPPQTSRKVTSTMLGHQLGDVLFSSVITAEPVAVSVLREAFTAAQREFSACQYVPLASRLSALIVAAEATVTSHPDPATHQLLAETYNLATRALIKLESSGLEWLSADRGLHAARAAADPADAGRVPASGGLGRPPCRTPRPRSDPHPRRSQPPGHLRCPPGPGTPGDARDAALLRRLRRRTGR